MLATLGFSTLMIPNQAQATADFSRSISIRSLNSLNVGGDAKPRFADLDGDGDLDAFVGEFYGTIRYYRNTDIDSVVPGTGFVADAAGNPLSGVAVGFTAAPSFADVPLAEMFGLTGSVYRNRSMGRFFPLLLPSVRSTRTKASDSGALATASR